MELLKTRLQQMAKLEKKTAYVRNDGTEKDSKYFRLLDAPPLSLNYWPKCKEMIRLYCYITK